MPDAPTAPAPPAPATRSRACAGLPSLHAVIAAIPANSLGVGFWLLMFREISAGNKEIALAIGSGLLGYLTHAALAEADAGSNTFA